MNDLAISLPALHQYIGPETGEITWWQMSIRALILFIFGMILVRLAGKRAIGQNAAFDLILAVVIGSTLSRAITGDAPFIATMIASAALVLLHWAVAFLTYHSRLAGLLAKGKATRLVRDGVPDEQAMRRARITEHDLVESARLRGVEKIEFIKGAHLERNGEISVIGRRSS